MSYVPTYKFICLNFIGFVVLYFSYVYGWVTQVLTHDVSYLSSAIFVLFIAGLISCGIKLFSSDKLLSNRDKLLDQYKNYNLDSLQLRINNKVLILDYLCNVLLTLGLIGTVVGLSISLGGITEDTVGDIDSIPILVSTLINGIGTALYTTLAGAIFSVWLRFNYLILVSNYNRIVAVYIELIQDKKADIIRRLV